MMAGRNDPCPCGSGKKYKKCCLGRDREVSLSKPALVPPPSSSVASSRPVPSLAPQYQNPVGPTPAGAPEPPEPPDPIAERGDAFWREFESQKGEARIAVFLRALEDAEAMDDELAFEMLRVLHADGVASGDRARFAACVDALRERRPEAFDKSGQYYLSWLLLDALAQGRQELVASLARELAARAGRDIDAFNRSAESLAYHGQLGVLVEALRIAWPLVKSSGKVVPWGITAFSDRGFSYEIYDYLEHADAPDPDDPALLDRLRFFIEDANEDYLRGFIADLTGSSGREWKSDDFALRPPQKSRRDDWDDEPEERPAPDPAAINLGRLINEFVGYLRREEGVPFPWGELVRHELYNYFLRRNEGKLDPHPSMLEQMQYPNRKLPKPPRPAHPLCPERVTLDGHIARMLGMMSGLYHSGAALFQAMPAWLRFLESRRLIDAATSRKVAADLVPLHESLLKIWEQHTEDPSLYRQEQAWPAPM